MELAFQPGELRARAAAGLIEAGGRPSGGVSIEDTGADDLQGAALRDGERTEADAHGRSRAHDGPTRGKGEAAAPPTAKGKRPQVEPSETPGDAPSPKSPPPRARVNLPDPSGVGGHWRYTRAAWAWFGAWRGRVAAEDAALKAAVEARDAALVAVGEATRALAADTPELVELQPFAATLAQFEAEAGQLTHQRDALQAELSQARADVSAAVGAFDDRLVAIRREAAPVELAVTTCRGRIEALDRQLIGLAARQSKGADPGVQAEVTRATASREEAGADLTRLEAQVGALRRRADALSAEQALTQKAGDRQLAELVARARRTADEAGQVQGRHRGTLMDLGHEALRRGLDVPALQAPLSAARDATGALDAARARRDAVLAERGAVDLGPCYRTVAVGAAVLLGIVLLVLLV